MVKKMKCTLPLAMFSISVVAFGISPMAYGEGDNVTNAVELVKAATAGLVASKHPDKSELSQDIDDFAPVTGWIGPSESAKAPEKKKIVAISCIAAAPFCNNVTLGVLEAAKALGWDGTYLDGKGNPKGFVDAYETAINLKPDAIIAMALPESVISTQIAKAHSLGIKSIGITVHPETISVEDGHYDAYVNVREDTNALMQAWTVIADSKGQAKVTWLWDPGFPFLMKELDRSKEIFANCKGCKSLEIGMRDLSAAANPVKMQEIASGLLARNPEAEYVLTAYGLNSHSVQLAAEAAGRNIKVVSKNADPVNVAFVSKGELFAESGSSPNWSGWTAMDDTVQVLSGHPVRSLAEQNLPQHIFLKANAPPDGVFDFGKIVDYKSKYLELWGRK
jgi:ribose transport system substrate-binding protein